MANFIINPEDSVFANGDAFSAGTANPDKLTLTTGAFLISEIGSGALLDAMGRWTVTINGTVLGGSLGLQLLDGNANKSKITVGTNGEVHGDLVGISALSLATIKTSGTVNGDNFGIHFLVGGTVTNTGTLSGGSAAILSSSNLAKTPSRTPARSWAMWNLPVPATRS